jgi:hypothetical protein
VRKEKFDIDNLRDCIVIHRYDGSIDIIDIRQAREKDRVIESEYYVIPEESNIGFITGINRKYVTDNREALGLALVYNNSKFKRSSMNVIGYTRCSLHYRDNSAYDKFIIYNGDSLRDAVKVKIDNTDLEFEVVGDFAICKMAILPSIAIVPSIDIRYTYVNNFSTLVSKDDTIELIDSAGNTRDLTYECDVHAMTSEEDKYRIMLNELAIYIENENLCISRL